MDKDFVPFCFNSEAEKPAFWNVTHIPSRDTFTEEPQHKDAGRDVEVWKSCVFFFFLFQVLHLQITRLESSSDCMFSFFFLYKGWFTGSERREDSLLSCEGSPDLTDPVSLKVDLLPDWRRDGAPFFIYLFFFFFFVQNTTAIPPLPVLARFWPSCKRAELSESVRTPAGTACLSLDFNTEVKI